MKRKLSPAFWLFISIAYMVLTFVLSSFSFKTGFIHRYKSIRLDLILHVIEYAILAFFIVKFLAAAGWLTRFGWVWWVPVVIGGTIGAANEIYQIYIPNRYPSVTDALANLVGVGLPVLWMRNQNAPARRTPGTNLNL